MFVESKIRAECTHHQVVFKRDQEWGWSPIVRKAYDLLLEGISQLVETKSRIGSSSLSNHRVSVLFLPTTNVPFDLDMSNMERGDGFVREILVYLCDSWKDHFEI